MYRILEEGKVLTEGFCIHCRRTVQLDAKGNLVPHMRLARSTGAEIVCIGGNRRPWTCVVCEKPTMDAYMVRNEVWVAAGFGPRDLAHPTCLEHRLGRPLGLGDLSDAPINDIIRWAWSRGTESRVGGESPTRKDVER